MYDAIIDQLSLDIDEDIDFIQLLEEIVPDEVELIIPDNLPKMSLDKHRMKRAIVGLLNPFYYEDTKLELRCNDSSFDIYILTERKILESDESYPNPSLFYAWRIMEAHGGQIQYELKEYGTEAHCCLPILQNRISA